MNNSGILSLFALTLCVFLITGTVTGQPRKTVPDDAASEISFGIRNFGINVKGSLKGLEGTIAIDPSNPSNCEMEVSVDASTINTGTAARDRHLRSDDYFDVAKHPRISIVSKSIDPGKEPGKLILHGNLTMRGTTRPISIPYTMKPVNGGYLFEGKFSLNRRDYKVGGNSISLSDDVTVQLKVFSK